jgi:hypothetical protein
MNRKERILDCRYYDGSDGKDSDTELFADYEKAWVHHGYKEDWRTEHEDMKAMGIDEALADYHTPETLICLLMNRYAYWSGSLDKDCFVAWFKEKYACKPTNRQIRKKDRMDDLMKRCRFYKGEETCPYTNQRDSFFWTYERAWVDKLSDSFTNAEGWHHAISAYPKIEEFAKQRNLPSSLIGVFISREEHWCGYIESQEDYIESLKHYYLKES